MPTSTENEPPVPPIVQKAPSANPHRLAVLTSHPIQYQAPLFRKLAAHPRIDLTVYFCSERGLAPTMDDGFGVRFAWDTPLLEGYKHVFLSNMSPVPGSNGFWQAINPGILTELRRDRPDAVLVHGYAQMTNWLAFAGASLLGIPLLLHGETFPRPADRSVGSTMKRLLLSTLFRRVSAFLPIGSMSRRFYMDYGIPDDKLFTAPYSVDNEFFIEETDRRRAERDRLRGNMGLPADLPVILYASKLIPRKRPLDLLRAYRRVEDRAGLVIVGDGVLNGEMRAFVKEHGLDNVRFVGFKNQGQLPRYYAMADAFALPSAYETWGLVINEAMCAGLPIVTTNAVAASYDLVREGDNGYIHPVGNVDALSEALTRLIESPERRRQMGQRSREIISQWSHDACVDGILQAIDHVTGTAPPAIDRHAATQARPDETRKAA